MASADTAIAVEAGGTSNGSAGTHPSGNVLSNDTDADHGDTRSVFGVTNAAGAGATLATSSISTVSPSVLAGLSEVPVAAAPEPAPEPQGFNSMLGSSPAGLQAELSTPTPIIAVRWETRSFIQAGADAGDIYTRSSGFRAMVAPSSEPIPLTFRGVEDQVVPAARMLNLQVPADAFVHTEANETVQLSATLADGAMAAV